MKHPYSKVLFDNVVYLGVGQGTTLRNLVNELSVKHWLLVDAEEQNIRCLNEFEKNRDKKDETFSIKQAIVTADEAEVSWYRYNLPEFNGIKKATVLNELFPGLKNESVTVERTVPFKSLLSTVTFKGENNLLIIDIPGQSLELLEALSESSYLFQFNFLDVTTQKEHFFENSSNVEELRLWLNNNFYHTSEELSGDPDFPILNCSLNRDHLKLKNELIQSDKEKNEAFDKISKLNEELNENIKLKKKYQEQAKTLNEKNIELEEQVKTLQTKVDSLQGNLRAIKDQERRLLEIDKRMEYLFEQQRLQLEQATNALGSHITDTSLQNAEKIKARLSLERNMGSNFIELNDAHSNLSEVVAASLLQKLSKYEYDLIIEFGSGKSTEFLANAILNNYDTGRLIEHNGASSSSFTGSRLDLPQHIISFEHDKRQYKKVSANVESNQLRQLVDLRYSPLIPSASSNGLFYDCDKALNSISNLLDNNESKLLIVFNDSITTQKPELLLLLENLLKYLSSSQLDIHVEKTCLNAEVLSCWKKLLEERGLQYEESERSGVCFFRVNL